MKLKRIGPARRSEDRSAWIAQILFQEDPLQISIGINSDEYESEAATIAPRLRAAAGMEDVLDIVYAEFCGWFGEDEAGRKSHYQRVAARIWNEWRSHHAKAGNRAATGGLAALRAGSKNENQVRPPRQ